MFPFVPYDENVIHVPQPKFLYKLQKPIKVPLVYIMELKRSLLLIICVVSNNFIQRYVGYILAVRTYAFRILLLIISL